jgi:pimeloyl-ACP methyl ester carboxylesterase
VAGSDAGRDDAWLRTNAKLELIEGCGHGVNLLQPERCAQASLDFWRAIELG